jgi:molybdopterin-guanine dinucleotide biosynthesis protein A
MAVFLAGLFVGGRGTRMGGLPKGLLPSPDGAPILRRTQKILENAGGSCVLVGAAEPYANLGLPMIPDDPAATGPLAGLLALLDETDAGIVLAVACDMPQITDDLVARLLAAPPAPIVAPRRQSSDVSRSRSPSRWLWEPLFARYEAAAVAPIARRYAAGGGRRLQDLLDLAGAVALPLGPEDDLALVDWDTPADVLPPAPARGNTES